MTKAIIIEDEKKSRELLENMIRKNCSSVDLLGAAESVSKGVELARQYRPDLIFLDIEMADGTGFDLLKELEDLAFEVIFTTASDKYALKAIKFSALDYLLKPIDVDDLVKAVEKISEKKTASSAIDNLKFLLQNFKRNDDQYHKITLPTGNAYEIVNVKDIIRCEAEGNYTKFFLNGSKKLLVSASLKHYEDLLPENEFIRIHHHHLININHVVRYLKSDGGYAVMSDGTQVEVSRRKKDAFLQRLQNI